jgi:hypothetical protein
MGSQIGTTWLSDQAGLSRAEKVMNDERHRGRGGSTAGSQRRPQIAAVAYNPLQAEWVTGKRTFVRTSLSNQAHYGGAGLFEPQRNRRPRGQAQPTDRR